MLTDADRVPLGQRLWVSDQARSALVAPDGTIDWFGSHQPGVRPVLGRLLDRGGAAVRVGLVRDGSRASRDVPRSEQGYRPGTLVAETVLDGAGGRVRLTDVAPWSAGIATPPGRIVRLVTALSGPIDVEVEVLVPSADARAGRVWPWSGGVTWSGTVVRCGLALLPDPLGPDRPRWRAVRRLDPGESLVVTVDDPLRADHRPLSVDAARRVADQTATAWRAALATRAFDGPWPDLVERSALVTLGLSPTGAPLTAATTSLPRVVGGVRNAESRTVLLRHAAAATATLASIGLDEAADDAAEWLRRTVDDLPLPWPARVDPAGGQNPPAEEWPLDGWRHSQPVLGGVDLGPPAIDALGDVVTAVRARPGGPLRAALPALRAVADFALDHWTEPDAGAWGRVVARRPLVASAVGVWTALDGMARLARAANPLDLDAVVWQSGAREVLAWLESAAAGGASSGPARSNGDRPPALPALSAGAGTDAAGLRLAWRGPWPADHPVVAATVDRVLEQLGDGPLVRRLSEDADDADDGPDQLDLEASLWAVRALAGLGHWEEAHERLDAVAGLAGVGGLFGTAADAISGASLGDRPAAGVHLAFVDASLAVARGPR